MVAALKPKAAGWWGQELSFALWCQDSRRAPDEAALREYAESLGVPIAITEHYPAFCRDVVAANLPHLLSPPASSSWRERWRRTLTWRRRMSPP